MDHLAVLPPATQAALWVALESVVAVRHRGELFLWAQGQMQALLPHGALSCLTLGEDRQPLHQEYLQGTPMPPDSVEQLRRDGDGLLLRLARLALRCDIEGAVLTGRRDAASDDRLAALADEWAALGLGALMFRRCAVLADGSVTFLFLFGIDDQPDERQWRFFMLFAPHIFVAYTRSLRSADEFAGVPSAVDDGPALTDRQLEILRWVKLGKTNYEIGQILSISEVTVKNHMQKVFRKLKVQNRVQAVGRIVALNLA